MGAKLTEFKDRCSDELIGSNPNPVVIKNYDALYALVPFKAAVCAMDGPNYCLINAGTNSTSTQSTAARRFGRSYVAGHSAAKRAQTVLVPNTNTYSSNYLMFLFTSPAMPAELLCTNCTANILSEYMSFQMSQPHALGSAKSPLLGGQGTLWSSMSEKCPADYMKKLSKGSSFDNSNSGAVSTAAGYFTALAAALAAAVALF
ncbi:hypothetical protein BN14_00025 [Rhizoctonia solani AG-1 IB]|nr:hypothetical protein BN14_00025 [Rhizoctonia solani AG-1 IB]